MNLQFLWDEEKTRKFLKLQLITYLIGAPGSFFYVLNNPMSLQIPLLVVAVLVWVITIANFFILSRPNPGIRLLIMLLLIQTAAAIYLAGFGGFVTIFQFASFAALFVSVNQLGAKSTTILGIYALATFSAVYIWQIYFDPANASLSNFLLFSFIYAIVFLAQRDLGKELSIQFEAKKKLEQVDSLKNQFMMITSHYLRTPLTSAKALIERLTKAPLPIEQREDIEKIEKTITDLDLLVEKFLTIASIEGGHVNISPLESDLGLIVASVISEYQPIAIEKKINLNFTPTNQHSRFSFDPVMIKEVLSNIIDNAIKYNRPLGTVTINLVAKNGYQGVLITDTGAGMDKEKQETLFSSFSKGSVSDTLNFSNPGLGLSLYLSKLIIDAHRGKIEFISQVGEGSSFTVWLPVRE